MNLPGKNSMISNQIEACLKAEDNLESSLCFKIEHDQAIKIAQIMVEQEFVDNEDAPAVK